MFTGIVIIFLYPFPYFKFQAMGKSVFLYRAKSLSLQRKVHKMGLP